MVHARGFSLVRDVVVATAILVALYGLAQGVRFPPVQIPGYLLIVGFDVLEGVFGSAGAGYPVLFGAYLVALALIGTAATRIVRGRAAVGPPMRWRLGVASALGVTGALSLLFAAAILVGTTQWISALITGVAGVILLGLAGWLTGLIDVAAGRE